MTRANIEANSKRQAALDLAARGFRVFPLQPNSKLPLKGVSWKKIATSDPARIADLWGDRPYNVGVATGGGLVVIDVDNKGGKRGTDSLTILETIYDELPATLTVETPSGGLHYYLTVRADLANSAGKLGRGLDIRGQGGYVVGPGSTIDGKAYVIKRDAPAADAPQWFVGEAAKARAPASPDRPKIAPHVELDDDQAIARATHYLKEEAPTAIEGAGGDDTTYRTAVRLRDFGLTDLTAFSLLTDHWNERCSPPWPLDDLAKKVSNAYRYGENALGITSAQADFEEADESLVPRIEARRPLRKGYQCPAPVPLRKDLDSAPPPPRRWVLGMRFIPGAVTIGSAPPGAAKSLFSLASCIAIAAGRSDITGETVHRSGPVWFHDNEDDEQEIERRALAICRTYKIDPRALDGRLLITSGALNTLVLARKKDRANEVEPTPAVDQAIAFLRVNAIVHVAIGPLLSLCRGVVENSNEDMHAVADTIRRMAAAADCSIDLTHHTAKNRDSEAHAGDPAAARGAGSVGGVGRRSYTLAMMSEASAAKLGISKELAARLVRLDYGKANYAARSFNQEWFELRSVNLNNGPPLKACEPIEGVEDMPNPGDSVGVPVRWDIQAASAAARNRTREEEKASVANVAEVVARNMLGTRCRLGDVIDPVMDSAGVKSSKARDLINAAIPREGYSEVSIDGQTFKLRMVRDGDKHNSPIVIEKTPDIGEGA